MVPSGGEHDIDREQAPPPAQQQQQQEQQQQQQQQQEKGEAGVVAWIEVEA